MRKVTVGFIFLFFALGSKAQVEKGRIMPGGNINYQQNSQKTKATSTNSGSKQENANFNTGIRCGYFIMDNLMAGILFNIGKYKGEGENIIYQATSPTILYHQRGTMNSVGLFGRYYHMLSKSKFAVFVPLDIRYGKGNSLNESQNVVQGVPTTENRSSSDDTQFSVTMGLGLTYFVTKNIAVESYFGNFGYSYSSSILKRDGYPDRESTQSGFNSNLNFNLATIYLGVNFYFGGTSVTKP
ncbi:MAG: hypothetical protein PSX36_06920 [bacterium]|nr:hypothetical protein [bacterium]